MMVKYKTILHAIPTLLVVSHRIPNPLYLHLFIVCHCNNITKSVIIDCDQNLNFSLIKLSCQQKARKNIKSECLTLCTPIFRHEYQAAT